MSSTTLSKRNRNGARVAGPAQGHAEKRQQIEERHADEEDAQVGHRQRLRVGRCVQPAHQYLRAGQSDSGNQDRNADKEHNAGADHALGPVEVLGAHALADQDRRRHADAEHGAEQEEQDRVGVRGCGERGLAEAMTDPDRIDRTVERLQYVASEYRQCKLHQGLADCAFGERGVRALQG
jgi:hypothetical protein